MKPFLLLFSLISIATATNADAAPKFARERQAMEAGSYEHHLFRLGVAVKEMRLCEIAGTGDLLEAIPNLSNNYWFRMGRVATPDSVNDRICSQYRSDTIQAVFRASKSEDKRLAK